MGRSHELETYWERLEMAGALVHVGNDKTDRPESPRLPLSHTHTHVGRRNPACPSKRIRCRILLRLLVLPEVSHLYSNTASRSTAVTSSTLRSTRVDLEGLNHLPQLPALTCRPLEERLIRVSLPGLARAQRGGIQVCFSVLENSVAELQSGSSLLRDVEAVQPTQKAG